MDPASWLSFSAINAAFRFSEFIIRLSEVPEENKLFVRLIDRVRLDLAECVRLHNSPSVQSLYIQDPPFKTWIESTIHSTRHALHGIGKFVECVRVDEERNGAVSLHKRFVWVLQHQSKLATRERELDTCHKSLLAGMQRMASTSNTAGPPPAYDDLTESLDGISEMEEFLRARKRRMRRSLGVKEGMGLAVRAIAVDAESDPVHIALSPEPVPLQGTVLLDVISPDSASSQAVNPASTGRHPYILPPFQFQGTSSSSLLSTGLETRGPYSEPEYDTASTTTLGSSISENMSPYIAHQHQYASTSTLMSPRADRYTSTSTLASPLSEQYPSTTSLASPLSAEQRPNVQYPHQTASTSTLASTRSDHPWSALTSPQFGQRQAHQQARSPNIPNSNLSSPRSDQYPSSSFSAPPQLSLHQLSSHTRSTSTATLSSPWPDFHGPVELPALPESDSNLSNSRRPTPSSKSLPYPVRGEEASYFPLAPPIPFFLPTRPQPLHDRDGSLSTMSSMATLNDDYTEAREYRNSFSGQRGYRNSESSVNIPPAGTYDSERRYVDFETPEEDFRPVPPPKVLVTEERHERGNVFEGLKSSVARVVSAAEEQRQKRRAKHRLILGA